MSDEQLQNIKVHLLKQLDNFPEDQRKIVKHKILSMNNKEMEEFIKENGLEYEKDNGAAQQCVFCAIAQQKLKSYKISENENYISILELNPLSRGHILIIPKKHILLENLPDDSIDFAKQVATIIFDKLNPKDIQFQKNEVLGHAALEVIPVYGDEKQEKKRASDEELASLQSQLVGAKEKREDVPKAAVEDQKLPKVSEGVADQLPKVEIKEEKKPELPKIKSRTGWL